MRILTISSFSGPNVWLPFSCTSVLIDVSADRSTSWILEWGEDLRQSIAACPVPIEPLSSLDPRASPRSIGDLIGHLSIDLQRHVGVPVQRSLSRQEDGNGRFRTVVEHHHPVVGALSTEIAMRMIQERLDGTPAYESTLPASIRRLSAVVQSTSPDGTAADIVQAAVARNIPVVRLDPRGARIELGNGAWRQRIWGSQTNLTSLIGERTSRDKFATYAYLKAAGLPVPEGRLVRTIDEAIQAANDIGYPIVLKPVDGGNSHGAFVGLETDAEIRTHFEEASQASTSGMLLVEKSVQGRQFRIVVVGARIVAVSEYTVASVIGDGHSTIAELIATANDDPRRGPLDSDSMYPIEIDAMTGRVLDRLGLTIDDVPARDQEVPLKQAARVANGGLSIDRTEQIHPHNVDIAIQAVETIDLDIAALDIIAADISQSIWRSHGAIIDVNANFHCNYQKYPAVGQSRDPGPAIVAMLFPPGQPVRVPIIAVIGDHSGQTCEHIASLLAATGKIVGMATESRLIIGGMELTGLDRTGAEGIRTILNNPAVKIAVAEVTAQGIVDEGLGFDYCDVAIVLSLSGLQTPFGLPVESVLTNLLDETTTLILDANNPATLSLASTTSARVLSMNGVDPDLLTITRQIMARIVASQSPRTFV